VVDHLKITKDMVAYLEAVLEAGDPALIAAPWAISPAQRAVSRKWPGNGTRAREPV
jgi:DNA-binding phage protein